jgi:hypothetical protein
MLVLKVDRGWFDNNKIQQRYPGCTVTFEHDGGNTLIKINGLTTKLNVMEELAFVKTCRTQPPHHGGQVQHHRSYEHAQTSPKQGQQGYHEHHEQHHRGHVQPSSTHRGGHVRPEESAHKGTISVQTPRQDPILRQGAWLCSKSNNGT